ncbi:MAG: hypothetical protein ABR991_02740 [Terracidiphilus sp.]|jgi:hypothetical protein
MNEENKKILLNGEKIANLDTRNLDWKKTRERGEVSYILRDVLIACVSLWAFNVGYEAYNHHLTLNKILSDSISPILEGLFAGFLTAIWTWNSNEKRYQKAIEKGFLIGETIAK